MIYVFDTIKIHITKRLGLVSSPDRRNRLSIFLALLRAFFPTGRQRTGRLPKASYFKAAKSRVDLKNTAEYLKTNILVHRLSFRTWPEPKLRALDPDFIGDQVANSVIKFGQFRQKGNNNIESQNPTLLVGRYDQVTLIKKQTHPLTNIWSDNWRL